MRYELQLKVLTKSEGSSVTIKIEDNGSGISDDLTDNIFQLSFTMKKGTACTRLGLSIIKAKGGLTEIDSSAVKKLGEGFAKLNSSSRTRLFRQPTDSEGRFSSGSPYLVFKQDLEILD